jgi:cell division protein FtsQ
VIDERIAERRAAVRDERRRSRLRRTLSVVLLLLVLVALLLVERSALVGLEEVRVAGTQRLDPADVRAAAALELGTSTLRLPLRAATERVEALPLVRQASSRRLDPLTVLIEVEERRPALVVLAGDEARLVDRDGIVIDEGRVDGPPIVRLRGEPPAVGQTVEADPALANAHRAWRGLSGDLRAQVTTYRAGGPDELTLELASGIEVRFGRAERIDEKVRALGSVLGDVGDTPVEVIDVRAPGAPVVVGE